MWIGSLFSAVLGNLLPGPGTFYQAQTLRFHARARIGDTLTVSVIVQQLLPPATVVLATKVERAGELIADGVAEVLAPATRLATDPAKLPQLAVLRHRHVARLLAACTALPPMPTAIVAPEEENALMGALAAWRARSDRSDLARRRGENSGDRSIPQCRSLRHRDRGSAEPRRCRRARRRTGASGRGDSGDEGASAHRRIAPPRCEVAGRPARRPAHQPRLRHGRAVTARTGAGDRRRHQYCADAGGKGRYRSERDRAWYRSRHRRSEGRYPLGGRDREPEDPVNPRRGRRCRK